MRRIGYLSVLGMLVMMLGILAACSGSAPAASPAPSEASVPSTAASPAPPSTEPLPGVPTAAGYDPATGTLTIIAKEYSFDAPESAPAGVTKLRVINQGQAEHDATLISLPEGHKLDEITSLAQGAAPPSWIVFSGGADAQPGATATATIKLDAGKYAIISTGADDAGALDFTKGMAKEIQVTEPGATTIEEPESTVTVTMKDYAFDLSPKLTSGAHTLKMENTGPQPHFMAVARLADGKTIDDYRAFSEGGGEGELPVEFTGMTGTISPGKTEWDTMNFAPGNYLLLCFMPDASDGKPHVDHGMIQQISVK